MRGEIEKWVKEGRPLTEDVPMAKQRSFRAKPNPEFVATRDWIVKNKQKSLYLICGVSGNILGLRVQEI